MSDKKQIKAINRNLQASSDHSSVQNILISRMNAIKTGIDADSETACGEDPGALAALVAQYDRDFQPMGVVERVLVDLIVHSDWMLRRYRFLSADLTNHSAAQPFNNKQGNEFGAGFAASLDAIHRLHRQRVDTERAYFRHLAELEARQACRRQRESEVQDTGGPSASDSPETKNSETGFVPQPTEIRPAASVAAPAEPAPQPKPAAGPSLIHPSQKENRSSGWSRSTSIPLAFPKPIL